jgi:PAS domain S-box-containing protein
MKIVVAEDEFLIADMLIVSLEDAGHEVRNAANGACALDLIREERPDLLITDFMMPLMTGLELAEAIKADAELKNLPILLVSGAQGGIARGRSDLFSYVVDKPYLLDEILEIANQLTGRRLYRGNWFGQFMKFKIANPSEPEMAGHEASPASSASRIDYEQIFARLPTALYATDAQGRITSYNAAAAMLWGRDPKIGEDLWCGTHRMFWPDGSPMRPDESPLARSLVSGQPIHGVEAAAERPDGSRYNFAAYPTPLFNEKGEIAGAVNMLVDLTKHNAIEAASHRLAAIVESSEDAR